ARRRLRGGGAGRRPTAAPGAPVERTRPLRAAAFPFTDPRRLVKSTRRIGPADRERRGDPTRPTPPDDRRGPGEWPARPRPAAPPPPIQALQGGGPPRPAAPPGGAGGLRPFAVGAGGGRGPPRGALPLFLPGERRPRLPQAPPPRRPSAADDRDHAQERLPP